jgi:hypothetical protein
MTPSGTSATLIVLFPRFSECDSEQFAILRGVAAIANFSETLSVADTGNTFFELNV